MLASIPVFASETAARQKATIAIEGASREHRETSGGAQLIFRNQIEMGRELQQILTGDDATIQQQSVTRPHTDSDIIRAARMVILPRICTRVFIWHSIDTELGLRHNTFAAPEKRRGNV